jgi:hypothetical protein
MVDEAASKRLMWPGVARSFEDVKTQQGVAVFNGFRRDSRRPEDRLRIVTAADNPRLRRPACDLSEILGIIRVVMCDHDIAEI